MGIPGRGIALTFALIFGICSGTARADEIIYTVVVDNAGGNFYTGVSGTFELPQFDDQGGTRELYWVALSVEASSLDGLVTLDNESPTGGTWATVAIGTDLFVYNDSTLAPFSMEVRPFDSNTAVLAADDPLEGPVPPGNSFIGLDLNADFAGDDSVSAGGHTPVTAQKAVTLDAADHDLSEFIGTGSLTYSFDSSIYASAEATVLASQTRTVPPDFHFAATVIYGMGVVPEPATMGLLVLGGLFTLLRRRRTRGPL